MEPDMDGINLDDLDDMIGEFVGLSMRMVTCDEWFS